LDCTSLVIGDRDILTLLNALIVNAFKHHPKDSGIIIITSENRGKSIEITVSDDGLGIPDEYSERVFAAMTTLKPRDEVEGSGMGLANVRKIARIYGGDAWVGLSPYGQGARVTVSLRKTVDTSQIEGN
jgi:signal transduction histidine kinase